MNKNFKKTVLLILDGYGLSDIQEGNAIKLAKTPNLDFLFNKYKWVKLNASGLAVGLPEGQMGNSEVGHLNIGAGRVVYQELTRITKSIKDGDFFENKDLLAAVNNSKKNNSSLHIYGLVSSGGVHSHIEHLYALIELAKKNNLKKVYVHAFLDGRDTPPDSGKNFIIDLENKLKDIGVGEIASIMGRYYAMDRDKRWDRIQKAYDAMVNGVGEKFYSAIDCIDSSYKNNIFDEFILPSVIINKNNNLPVGLINNHDSIIFFNFRPDRARQITRVFCDKEFNEFEHKNLDLVYTCFTDYDASIKNKLVAYKPEKIKNTLGEYISSLGLKQLRIAETEKYAHVTFFFNGGVETPNKNEDRILIPSPKVATYDLKPEMSIYEVTNNMLENILDYDLVIANFANSDMVGHTGILDAAIKAVEHVDACVKKLYDFIIKNNMQLLICADHGNSDQMIDYKTKQPFTAHTTNPVPFLFINCDESKLKNIKQDGALCNIAPTILKLMNLDIPKEMTGEPLI